MDEYMGIVKIFAGTFAPRNWAFCNGQLLPISQYSALFSILGTNFGGDGRTTFGLPDLRGRVPVNSGGNSEGPGLSTYRVGERIGVERTQLGINNIPAHNHIITVSESVGTVDIPVNSQDGNADDANPATGILANTGTDNYTSESPSSVTDIYGGKSLPVRVTATATASMTGSSVAFNNIQPSLGINYIICLEGLFPPRS